MARFRQERGFAVVASVVFGVVLFGMAGLAIDLGRMYITKNEAQTYADGAALAAAMQLDGTPSCLTRADAAVSAQLNKWNFSTTTFGGTVTEYSADGSTGWAASDTAVAADMRYARVKASVNNVALFFLPITGTATTATVNATAIAGQVLEGTSSTNPVRNSVFPYSPIANTDTNTVVSPVPGVDPFGFVVGQQYDLKWPHSAQIGTLGANKVPCQGDNNAAQLARSQSGTDWGEIVLTSASSIYSQIAGDAGGINVYLGQSVQPTNGDKNKEVTAFNTRAAQDSNDITTCQPDDSVATCKAALDSYKAGTHNGRRLVTVIVNNGLANSAGVSYPSSQQAIGIGYATFWLLTDYSKQGGSNNPWCAVYAGPSSAPGTQDGGGGGSTGATGVGMIRLTL